MAKQTGTYRKLSIPPIFGRPKERKVDFPQYYPSNIWLVRLDDEGEELEKLKVQTVPLELGVTPDATWVTINSIGRNNPFYQYTGGEDTLAFTLDWYSVIESRNDVIDKCRWIESLSRNNAYLNPPPRILLIFGALFKYTTWIIEEAPYRLSLFDREKSMFPRQAYQDLVLKKVTDRNTGINTIRGFYPIQ